MSIVGTSQAECDTKRGQVNRIAIKLPVHPPCAVVTFINPKSLINI